jgi:trigger factor
MITFYLKTTPVFPPIKEDFALSTESATMKIDLNRTDDVNAKMTIVIEPSDYIPLQQENLKNYSKKLNIKGFRSGKTPKSVLTKMYGKGLLEETISKLLNEKLFGYLESEKVDIFGNPMLIPAEEPLDFNPNIPTDYTFVFDLGLKPAFDLRLNTDSPLNIKVASTDPAGIEEDIKRYRRVFGTEVIIEEGVVEPNDRVKLKLYRLNEDGTPEEKETETTVDLERTQGEAKTTLLNQKRGFETDVDLEKFLGYSRPMLIKNTLGLESDPNPDKPLNYKVKIESIGRPQETELTGEQLSKYVGPQFTDESSFRDLLEKRENESNAARNTDMKKMAVRLALLEANPFVIPEEFLLKWVNMQREKKIEAGTREANNLFREAKWSLLLNSIAKAEGLEVTEKDIQKQVTNWIIQNVNYQQTDVRKLMKKLYADEYFMSTMKENALEEVVFNAILPLYQFNETAVSPHEFEHAFHDLHHELFDHGDHSHEEYH